MTKRTSGQKARRNGYLTEVLDGLKHAAATSSNTVANRIEGASGQLARNVKAWGNTASRRVDDAGHRLADNARHFGQRIAPN